jgi:hypothetical protein
MKQQELQKKTKYFIDSLQTIVKNFPTSWLKQKAIVELFKKIIDKHMHALSQIIENLNDILDNNEEQINYYELDQETASMLEKALEDEFKMDLATQQTKTITAIEESYNRFADSYISYYSSSINSQNILSLTFNGLIPAGLPMDENPF